MIKKVGIVGVGNVGATLAFILASKNICDEIVLKDIRENILEAMTLDISQASAASNSKTKVSSAKEAKEFNTCDIVVITAGIPRKPGMSRDDLLITNANIMISVIKETIAFNPNAVIIIVSNPLDAMVYTALKASSFKREKIIGMAGILDSSRMAHFISKKLNIPCNEIETSVMGGHGDAMVPLVNYTKVQNKKLSEFLNDVEILEIMDKTRKGGAQIVAALGNGSAYYAPAYSTYLMINAILNDTKEIYPCAVLLEGEYDYSNIVAGVPIVLGKKGLEEIVELNLSVEQKEQFKHSVLGVKELTSILDKEIFN
ncbi:MAG: malate dehydrogenase [Campylobacteraceae bacterium]|nr:malate dehydrogenase [Campylobacteraceae bacterium]